MIHRLDLTLARSSLFNISGVVGVGYGLKETGGKVTQVPAWRAYVREKMPLRELRDAERVPAHIGELSTDVITYAPASLSAGSVRVRPLLGVKIANSRGVPGTLGCIARTLHDKQTVLLSNWHVLFGNGGYKDGEVWLVDETHDTRHYSEIGRTLYGKIGGVRLAGEDYYVDCAVGSCLHLPDIQHLWSLRQASTKGSRINGHDTAQLGDLVTKTGAATGTTAGIVVDIKYSDFAWIEGRSYPTPQQLLVRPVNNEAAFSAEGDSGAVIINTMGKAVGLLWGTNSRGEGVACPIGPVLHTMNITLLEGTI